MTMKRADPARRAIQAYLAAQPPRARRALKQLRATVKAAAPDAVEAWSYKMPAFRLDGRILVWIAGFKEHCSMFPLTGRVRRALGATIEKFHTAKGTIRFPLEKPVPTGLVKRLVKARVADLRR